jgi:hypothetical protein
VADIIQKLIQARQNAPDDGTRTMLRAAINEIYKLRGQMKDAKVLINAGIKALGTGPWEGNKDEEPELPLPSQVDSRIAKGLIRPAPNDFMPDDDPF